MRDLPRSLPVRLGSAARCEMQGDSPCTLMNLKGATQLVLEVSAVISGSYRGYPQPRHRLRESTLWPASSICSGPFTLTRRTMNFGNIKLGTKLISAFVLISVISAIV